MGDENMDVAVFRFTLGIPGFEDRLIPRVVGGIGAALLGINHIISAQPYPPPQGRAELLVGALALILAVVPEIEERLREAQPGRGRQAVNTEGIAGATNAFLLDSAKLTEKAKQELAWASFALLKNTNSCSIIVQSSDRTLMARGQLGKEVLTLVAGQTDALDNLSSAMVEMCWKSPELANVLSGKADQLWLPNRSSINSAGVSACKAIPSGVESMLAQHIPSSQGTTGPGGILLLMSERPKALSDRERTWAAAMAKKLML